MHGKAILLSLFISSTLAAPVLADTEETLPLWEIGGVGVALVTPDYPGADEYQYLALPVPYIIYRGEFLRAERGGLRGIFLETDDLELNVSLGGNLPTDDDTEAREGMPDLDPLIEVGPSLEYVFHRSGRSEAGIRLPVRVALSVFGDDEFIDYQGIVVNPELTFNTYTTMYGKHVGLAFSAGPIFGFDGINDYFYSVAPRYARAGRGAYESDDGYMEFEVGGSIGVALTERWRFFAAGGITYLAGASNEDSPLFKDDFNAAFATGITWSFYQSEQRVPAGRR